MYRATLDGLDELLSTLEVVVGDELAAALTRGAEAVAFTAKADHPYTDRTGNLTASIEALPAVGSLRDGTLAASVVAGMGYASFVEQGTAHSAPYPYLEPALDANEGRIEEEAERGLAQAVDRVTRG